ncbi:MAG: hypothetical protein M3367_19565 [Acidobacteriota bacterium]|nr:hypothetical protein [Acidobacteriota bacterium]
MKLYEKEIAGAEKQLILNSLSEKLSVEAVETSAQRNAGHINRSENLIR